MVVPFDSPASLARPIRFYRPFRINVMSPVIHPGSHRVTWFPTTIPILDHVYRWYPFACTEYFVLSHSMLLLRARSA
jgi:hypothetical protein